MADLLQLITGIPAAPAADRSRLGLLNIDLAGYPNGRRVSDDVTDIAARVMAGVLAGPPFAGFSNNGIVDVVNADDVDYLQAFPQLGTANSASNRRHVDSDEPGCAGTARSIAGKPTCGPRTRAGVESRTAGLPSGRPAARSVTRRARGGPR